MNTIKVNYRLIVGNRKFKDEIRVLAVPQIGSLLKISNNSFVVTEHEQDLDSYEMYNASSQKFGSFCEKIEAELNPKMYNSEDHEKVIKELLESGWKEQN
jgi:hypothetical protein